MPIRVAGYDQAVGEFVVMHDRAATAMPPHAWAIATGWMHDPIVVLLEVTERECRLRPAIQPQCWRFQIGSRLEQVFVGRHIPGAAARLIDDKPAVAHDEFIT